MPTCSAYGCSYKSCRSKVPGKTAHRFPFSRPAILRRWVLNVRRANWKPSHRSVLCSDHFEPECFDRKGSIVRLHRHAVPTIFNFPNHLQTVVKEGKFRKRKQFQDHSSCTTSNEIVMEEILPTIEANEPSTSSGPVVVNILGVKHDHNYHTTVCGLKRKISEKQNAKKMKLLQQSIRRLRKKLESTTI